MSKFYQTKNFKELNAEWRAKLEKSGFTDQEDENENLSQFDRRTQAFTNRDKIHDFFRKLDTYLSSTKGIPREHKKALSRYSRGMSYKEIASDIGVSKSHIGNIIKKYKEKILSSPV